MTTENTQEFTVPYPDAKTLFEYRRNFRAAQEEIRNFYKDVAKSTYGTNSFASLPAMTKRARDIVGKYGFGLRFGQLPETKQVTVNHHGTSGEGGQTVLGRFFVAVVPDNLPIEECGEFRAEGWFDLFGTADWSTKSNRWTMTQVKENGGAFTYAFRYLLSALFACPMDEEDPERHQRNPDQQGSAQNARAAANAQGGYKQPSGGAKVHTAQTNASQPPPASDDSFGDAPAGDEPQGDAPVQEAGKIVSNEKSNMFLDRCLGWINSNEAKLQNKDQKAMLFFTEEREWQGRKVPAFRSKYKRQNTNQLMKYMPSIKQWGMMISQLRKLGAPERSINEAVDIYRESGGSEEL